MIKCSFDTLSQLVVNYIFSIDTVKLPKRRFAGSNGYSPFSEEVRLYIICAIKYDSLYGYWIKHIVPFFYNTMCRMEGKNLGYIGKNDQCMIQLDKNDMKNKKPNAEK